MLRIAARTSTGRCRDVNEDAYSVFESGSAARQAHGDRARLDAQAAVICVYDGCGSAGLASRLAAGAVAAALSALALAEPGEAVTRRLVAALHEAGREIVRAARAEPSHRGMGTTGTIAAVSGERLDIAHVGDTRAYLFRDSHLTQLTRDDTLVNDLLDAGQITPEEVRDFPHKNVLTRALGLLDDVHIGSLSVSLRAGDIVMLCTDGITSMLDDDRIAALMRHSQDPEVLCDLLVDAAEDAGGHDNETVAVAIIDPGAERA